jgi:hypothetical protein
VPRLLLRVPEHPEEAEQQRDRREDADEPAERRAAEADRRGAALDVDDADPERVPWKYV